MSEVGVDPIQYAWSRCNPGLDLPALLARSAARQAAATPQDAEFIAARRAAHSDLMQRRAPRQVQELRAK